jgi:tetratricopeptide (TPR) repeat protein
MRQLAALFSLVISLSECAPAESPADHIRGDLATMRSEHSVDKLVVRGRAFASVGDLTRAEQYLSAALDVGGDPAVLLPQLLTVCIEANRYRVAIAYASPWLERHPGDRKLRFVVASLRTNVGDALGARADLERLVTDGPNDPRAHFAYAVLLRDYLGDVAEADGHFRAYLRLDPNGPHAEEARSALLRTVP